MTEERQQGHRWTQKKGKGTGKSVTLINIYSTLGLHHMTVCKPSTSTELV